MGDHAQGGSAVVTTFASLGMVGLSVDEKLALIGQLWDDLVASVPPGGLLTDAQREELQRRVADAAARADDWVSWEEALAATLKRLSG
jgi:putative addiction module component (TIGR02574 family)